MYCTYVDQITYFFDFIDFGGKNTDHQLNKQCNNEMTFSNAARFYIDFYYQNVGNSRHFTFAYKISISIAHLMVIQVEISIIKILE